MVYYKKKVNDKSIIVVNLFYAILVLMHKIDKK